MNSTGDYEYYEYIYYGTNDNSHNKGERRKSSIGIYLSALAIADILVLTLPGMEFWLITVHHKYIRDSSDLLCKLFSFVTPALACLSAWILVALSIERMLRVCAPLKMNVLSKPKHAIFAVAAVTVTVSAIFLPLISGSSLEKFGNMSICLYIDESIFTPEAFTALDMTFLFAAPFLIMLINNSIILVKVAGCVERYCGKSRESNTVRNSPRHQRMLKTITRRVILLCVTYMTCNAPLMILNAIGSSTNYDQLSPLFHNLNFMFHILLYLNNSINFLLYCLIGSSFRNDCLKMMSSFMRKLCALCHIGTYK
ncbi:delta-type opioid receptor-like isoform X2 [Mya arenaria]|nr:delta-type opioid receptor-like isoform X2 [Mya arenaria]